MENLYFNIMVTLNDTNYQWHDPQVRDNIEFSIPVEFFDPKNFSAFVDGRVKSLIKQFPAVKAEFEQKQENERLMEEKEKAKVEEAPF